MFEPKPIIPAIRVVKYSSPYPEEIIYTSDKGFTVRLKAMIERAMDDLGYNTHDDKLKAFMEFIGENAEGCLFASRSKEPNDEIK